MTTLYLVRHCEAMGNIRRIFQGHTDEDISENGQRQLARLTERFRDIPLDAIYSSPLRRALRTAEAIDGARGLPITQDRRLMEIDGGVWEGKPWKALPLLYPIQSLKWSRSPWDFHPRRGEAMREVFARMAEVLAEIAAAHPDGTVAVASHGCAIRNALCWAKGWPIEGLNEVAWCDNTGVSVLRFDEGRVQLVLENDNTHLSEGISTFAKQTWWKK